MRNMLFGLGIVGLAVLGLGAAAAEEWKPKSGNPIIRDHRGKKPDLRITGMSVSGSKVTVTVENIGQRGAPPSRVQVEMFKMVNGRPQLHAAYFAMAPAVMNGKRATATVTFPFPVAKCTLVATVDYLGEIIELNENNNKFTKVVK